MDIKKKKLPLTIVILTNRNDNRFIDALRSAQIAKNILIIDNKSNNDLKKLEKIYNFDVISHENKITNFSKIRNYALEKVKTEWVFFLDSDESLGKSLKELNKNKKIISQTIKENLFDGVWITRKDVFLGKNLNFGEAGNIKLIRMFKVSQGYFTGSIHETALINDKLGETDITISHLSHESIANFLTDVSKYSEMAAKNEQTFLIINIIKMIFFPLLKFIQNYFVRLGFLDGFRGLIYAIMMSLHSFFVRVFYFEKYLQKDTKDNNEHQI